MFPIIRLGPLSLQAPGLMLLLSLWIGITLTEKSAKAYKVLAEKLSNLILIALVAGILGARIAYIAQFPQAFAGNLLSILSLNPGLLDITGGVAAAIIGALIYGQKKEMEFWKTLDALIPFFGMLAIGLATSNLSSGNAFGTETDLPWGINLWGMKRHPTQIYTMLAALLTLNLLWPPKQNTDPQAGTSFLTFIAFTAIYTLFLETFRGDSTLIFGGIRSMQLIALIVLALSFYFLDKVKEL
ncbi:MAG: prolipoprotein diacylglyceryl transferase [Chloroflexi bacterium]|nr:prolipoprotein diacylglyceryl transferase [Chloroflexota bacterium]